MSFTRRCCALLTAVLLSVFLTSSQAGNPVDETRRQSERSGQLRGEPDYGAPIDHGRLIVRGSVIAGPYRVGFLGREVFIDEVRIATLHGFRDSHRRSWQGRSAISQFVAEVERRLYDGQTMIVFDQKTRVFLEDEEACRFVGLLAEAKTDDERIRAALDCGAGVDDRTGLSQIPTSQWRTALADFQVTESLEEYLTEGEELSDDTESDPSIGDIESRVTNQPFYVLNVAGMVLVAVSLGTLLGFRPPAGVAWSQIIDSGQAAKLVLHSTGLIVILSSFDLTATILANSAGGFSELNPIAKPFLQSPIGLSVFKTLATGVAVLILWKRRLYAGIQKAAWWGCLILTLVTMRWVVVQSLFYVRTEPGSFDWFV